MIENLIDSYQYLLSGGCLIIAMTWIPQGFPLAQPRWGRVLGIGLAASILAAALLGSSILRDRELYASLFQGAALIVEASLLLSIWGFATGRRVSDDQDRAPLRRVGLLVFLLMMDKVPGFLLSGAKALGTSQTDLSSDTIVVLLTLTAGVGLGWLAISGLIRMGAQGDRRWVWALTAGLIGLAMVDQIFFLLQVLMARGGIPRISWVMKTMIFVSTYRDALLYAAMGLLAILPIRTLLAPSVVPSQEAAPAQKRRARAFRRREIRWAGTVAGLIASGSLFIAFGPALAEAPVILSEAEPVLAQSGVITVNLDLVDDGALHRYTFATQDETDVRFIVIRKGGASYGVGLDACEVCGPSGYFERQGQVICRLCDVQMNKATIGFPGGCNPVPLKYTINSGQLVIQADDLESQSPRFR